MRRPGGVFAAALAVAGLVLAGCGRGGVRTPAHDPHAVPMGAAACLILTEPAAGNALIVNAGAVVDAPRCELHVDSRARPAAQLNADSKLDVAALCVAGDIDRRGGVVTQPLPGCAAAVDADLNRPVPDAAKAPCDTRPPAIDGGTVRLQPGVYCGGLAFNGAPHVTFAPGLYVIRGGDWSFNGGDYVGREVSFYFADRSKPVFGGGVDVSLAAPVSGPLAGVLMDEAPGLAPSPLIFNAARRMNLEGLVRLPSRQAVFNTGSTLSGDALTIVLSSAVLNGTHWTIGFPAHRG